MTRRGAEPSTTAAAAAAVAAAGDGGAVGGGAAVRPAAASRTTTTLDGIASGESRRQLPEPSTRSGPWYGAFQFRPRRPGGRHGGTGLRPIRTSATLTATSSSGAIAANLARARGCRRLVADLAPPATATSEPG